MAEIVIATDLVVAGSSRLGKAAVLGRSLVGIVVGDDSVGTAAEGSPASAKQAGRLAG